MQNIKLCLDGTYLPTILFTWIRAFIHLYFPLIYFPLVVIIWWLQSLTFVFSILVIFRVTFLKIFRSSIPSKCVITFVYILTCSHIINFDHMFSSSSFFVTVFFVLFFFNYRMITCLVVRTIWQNMW